MYSSRFCLIAGVSTAVALAAPAVGAVEVYNDFYNHFNEDSSLQKDGQNPPDDVASWAYFANQADAWGGLVGFDSPTTRLDRFSVIMSNWNGWDPEGGPGVATDGYTTPLTLELYDVNASVDGPSASLGEFTEQQEIAGRQIPTAANAAFVGNGTDFVVDWDLDGLSVSSQLLFMVRVDELVGASFQDPPANTALRSLNIAASVISEPLDVTAGNDPDDGIYWRSDVNTDGEISRFDASAFDDGVEGGGQVFARATAVPAPSVLSLLLAGACGLLGLRRAV